MHKTTLLPRRSVFGILEALSAYPKHFLHTRSVFGISECPSVIPSEARNLSTMQNLSDKNRITELDTLRGIAILCMAALHVFYFGELFGGRSYEWITFFWFLNQYGGAFFVLVSGVCVTLGSKSVKRGMLLFLCGMCLTAITVWLYKSGRDSEDVLIQWGVLHCLGMCMILWPAFKRLSALPRIALGLLLAGAGYYLYFMVRVRNPWLFPLGLRTWHFVSMNYFPLLPHLGWFLIGSGLGTLLYKDRQTLIPVLKPGIFAFCGRHSLAIYLIHQPLLYLIFKTGGNP